MKTGRLKEIEYFLKDTQLEVQAQESCLSTQAKGGCLWRILQEHRPSMEASCSKPLCNNARREAFRQPVTES